VIVANHLTLPVSSGGWNARDPIDQMPAADAILYDNLVHTAGADVVRNGYAMFSDNADMSNTKQYDQLFAYNAGDGSRIIGLQQNILKSFSMGGQKMLEAAIGEGAADFRAAQFTDGSGQIWLVVIRGGNEIWRFKADEIEPAGFTTGDEVPEFVGVFAYKNRLWFVERGSFNLWYGGIQAISGPLTQFSVGPFFRKSGRILGLGSWTQDGGDGPEDQLCIFSDGGEVLIYSGLSPESDDWAMRGRYDTEVPINDKCIAQIKGDIIMGTTAGYLPLSAILAELSASRVAVSGKINPYIKSKNFGASIWKLGYWPQKGWLIANAPSSESSLIAGYHVLNFENNTWSRFLGQNARDFCFVQDRMFFCRDDGIFEDGVGNLDNGAPIKWRKQAAYSDFGVKYKKKVMRWIPRIDTINIPNLYKFVWTDFRESAKTFLYDNLAEQIDDNLAKWDSSKWEQSKWADLSGKLFSIKSGIFHKPATYISLGLAGESKTETKILSADLMMVVANGTL
jgi:hypothetical protein